MNGRTLALIVVALTSCAPLVDEGSRCSTSAEQISCGWIPDAPAEVLAWFTAALDDGSD